MTFTASEIVKKRRARFAQKDPAEVLAPRIAALVPSLAPFSLDIAKEMLNKLSTEDGYLLVPKSDVVEML